MKLSRLVLAAGLALAAATAPLSAFAASKDKEAAYTKEQLAQGAKEAPAAIQAAGTPCTITDAAFLGQAPGKDDAGKAVKQNVYEVACKEGLGYAVLSVTGGKTQAYDCLTAAAGGGSLKCKLPENADPKQGLAPLAAAAGRSTCTIADARAVGASAKGDTFYEVKCQQGSGFLLQTAAGTPPKATDCALAIGTNLECKLTSTAEIQAAQKADATQLLAKAGKTCALTNSRFIGALQGGGEAYEVACGTSGYVVETDAKGGVKAIECAKADSVIAGGCTLTNSAEAETQEAATYTRLSAKSGFPCQVSKYHFVGLDSTKSEVVELACANRPDGGVGVFPSDNSPGRVYDCVAAGALGTRCQLTSPSLVYAKYTQELAARGKTSCKVSDARYIGRSTEGDYVETACSDGLPGWVVRFTTGTTKIAELLSCGQASGIGGGCKLPGNGKH